MKVEIISAMPEDTDFIAWIVAQGMHMNGVPRCGRNGQGKGFPSRHADL